MEATHLQYADDTLIFCGAGDGEEQLKYSRVIIVLFEGISGLLINRRRSLMYPINEVTNINWLATILGGEVGSLPTNQGLLLGLNLNL